MNPNSKFFLSISFKKPFTHAQTHFFLLRAEIRALIAAKDVPSPKKPKAKKAAVAAASPLASAVSAAPPVDLFFCVLEPVPGDEDSAMRKVLELGAGVHHLGRGESTGIDLKALSRQQVELHVNADDHSVVFVRKGTNVSRLLRAGRDPLDAVVDQPYVLAAGDQFALLGEQFRYNVKTIVKSAKPATPASVPTPSASLPPLGSAPVAGGKELPSWMTAGAPASAPPTTSAAVASTSVAATKPAPKPKAASAKTTSLEPAKKKAKTSKKKKKDDDEEEDANEPNTYDLEDSFIDDDAPAEPPARDDGGDDSDDSDDDGGGAAAAGKKRAVDKISTVRDSNDGDDDDDDEDLGELAREARAFVKSGGITTSLPPCRYGAKCYRTNAEHLADFSHPPREVDMAVLAVNAAKLVPELSVEQRIESLTKVYPRIERDVIRDMLAANGNAVSAVTELLATMDEEAAEAALLEH